MSVSRIIFVCCISLLFASNCFADRLPLWELGAAIGYGQVPYYRGSASHRNIVLPLPLAVYRGKKYSVDDEGAHKWLFTSKSVKLDFSLAAGLPVPRGEKDSIREGMPGLDTLIEVGPVLHVSLWRAHRQSITLSMPLRAATSISIDDIGFHGWFFSPFINYMVRGVGKNYWEFDLAFGPHFGSNRYHEYYYSVAREYATASRPEFDAAPGYSGSRLTVYLQKAIGRLWLSAFARYDDLANSAFEKSPLVEKRSYLIGGFVIGWMFAVSPQKVLIYERDDF